MNSKKGLPSRAEIEKLLDEAEKEEQLRLDTIEGILESTCNRTLGQWGANRGNRDPGTEESVKPGLLREFVYGLLGLGRR